MEKQEGMNWKGTRRAVLIAGGGKPSVSTIAGNHDPFLHAGTCQFVQLPRRRGGAEPPTSSQPPRGAQGRRLLGPAMLRSCPPASVHGQVRARLGLGGYCRRSGNGGPQTCLPAAWLKGGPSAAHLHQHKPKTLARATPRGADDTELPQAQPHQAGSRGGGEIKAGYLTRFP